MGGSERKEDSSHHTAERQREGAEINSSLHALKECIRALSSGAQHVPYRMSNLTRILRDSFTRPDARLTVVATVAPGCSDAEHSVATLRMGCGLCQCSDQIKEHKEDVKPVGGTAGNEQVRSLSPSQNRRLSAPLEERRNFYSQAQGTQGQQTADAKPTEASHRNRYDGCENVLNQDRQARSACQRSRDSQQRACSRDRRLSDRSSMGQQPVRNSYGNPGRPPDVSGKNSRMRSVSPMTPTKAQDGGVHPSKWDLQELQSWLQRAKLSATLPNGA